MSSPPSPTACTPAAPSQRGSKPRWPASEGQHPADMAPPPAALPKSLRPGVTLLPVGPWSADLACRCGTQWAWPQFYHALLLSAKAGSDLLSPASWRGSQARQFSRRGACTLQGARGGPGPTAHAAALYCLVPCAGMPHPLQALPLRTTRCWRSENDAKPPTCCLDRGVARRVCSLSMPPPPPLQCRHAAGLDARAGGQRGLP